MKKRIVIAITGATGSVYGWRLLEGLASLDDVETHLVVTHAAALTMATELDIPLKDIESLADCRYSDRNIGAAIASGSFSTDAMIIAPCSMKTLARIATGVTDSLVARAADVTLKERRKLILLVRESPLHLGHLRNMVAVTEMGGIVYPPMPAFYAKLDSIADMVEQTVARVIELLGLPASGLRRWEGLGTRRTDGSD